MPLALYRKYRPKTFTDLLGQSDIAEVLQNAARKDKLAQAYLLYGPRGSGKTTVARLIAKVANCEMRRADLKFKAKGEPCNACRVCDDIDRGLALDVMEIDGASNNGIEEVRSLKEGIKLAPTAYLYKVIIIDEVHMLSRAAFNALLKTLEEPPAHAMIILATTEYDKVPATITSRAQRFHFKRLPICEITAKLSRIAASEKLNVTDGALEFIAAIAEGSLRDAESLLGQAVALEGKIDVTDVERIIGKAGSRAIRGCAELLVRRNLHGTLASLNKLYEGGHNIVDFNKDLIAYLRRVLSLKFDPAIEPLFAQELTAEDLAHMKTLAVAADPAFVIALLKSLIRAYSEMRYSPIAIAPLEVAIIEHLR